MEAYAYGWRGGNDHPEPGERSIFALKSDLDSLQEMLRVLQEENNNNRNNHNIKQFRIEFRLPGTIATVNSTSGYLYHELQYHDFNIASYKNCKSITFAAYIASYDLNNI